jgi:hypothetical protein
MPTKLLDIPPEDVPELSPFLLDAENKLAIQQANLAAIHAAGIKIAIGSDSGNMGVLHGGSFHRELERVFEAGLSNMDVIVAATRNGAQVFKENPNFGTLEKNKLADMLILSANPLDDLANLQSIEYVIKNGRVFPHQELVQLNPEDIPSGDGCVPSAETLCLNRGNRFAVTVAWLDFDGNTGAGQALDIGKRDSGLFSFFNEDNVEMVVKVLTGCSLNNHYWVFFSGATNIELTVTVTDTMEGITKTYFNPLGQAAVAVTDTQAFATCP